MDVQYVWEVCWNRTAILFNIQQPCNWVVSTAYDFFHRSSALVEEAKGSLSVAVPDVALAAAARAAKAAEDTRVFAQAAIEAPPQRMLSAAEQRNPEIPALQPFPEEAAAVVAAAIAQLAVPDVVQPSALPLPPRPAALPPATSSRKRGGGGVARAPPALAPSLFVEPPVDLELNPFWPKPNNLWMPGAVQCALCCNSCRTGVWQSSHRGMLNHYRAVHNSEFQLELTMPNVSGPENVIVIESCWCIKGMDGDGTASTNPKSSWMPCKRRRA
jgi:hypothetical protein